MNPRPPLEAIDEAAKTGMHATERGSLKVVGRFDARKVAFYRKRLFELFGEEYLRESKPRWLDIGAGYGELVAAVEAAGATAIGLEPCLPKQRDAVARGLDVRAIALDELTEPFDVVSLINVFSHLPDPREFLGAVSRLVRPGGNLMLVTGNGADIPAEQLPRPLDLPDHLVFAGESHLERLLTELGFRIARVNRYDEFMPESRLVLFVKNAAKTILGRPRRTPTRGSAFRSLFIRAIREE
ncbi:MAG: class I SAM-dependent methyltransferase [Gammaproteobacteria bacterium]|nr:class I SAM-dependent methyltransferase [Gammaproteobacteria bacterium]